MKQTRIIFAVFPLLLMSCSDSDALSASEEIIGFWRLDSTVVYEGEKKVDVFDDFQWTVQFEKERLTNCIGGKEEEVRYVLNDTEPGKGKMAVRPSYGKEIKSDAEFTDKDHFMLIQKKKGTIKKWYHSRVTEKDYQKNCN